MRLTPIDSRGANNNASCYGRDDRIQEEQQTKEKQGNYIATRMKPGTWNLTIYAIDCRKMTLVMMFWDMLQEYMTTQIPPL